MQSSQPKLTVLHSVRCLECTKVYAKPVTGGTVWANPGCPHCGYVGWLPLTAPDADARPRRQRPLARRERPLVAIGG